MPIIELPIKPGIIKDNSRLQSESRWIDGDKIRFRRVGDRTMPEVIGGYEDLFDAATSGYVRGKARTIHVYETNENVRQVAVGTSSDLYCYTGALLWPITPIRSNQTLSNAITTTSGSATVSITSTTHGATSGDYVLLDQAAPVGGINLGSSGSFTDQITARAQAKTLVIESAAHGLSTGDAVSIAGAAGFAGIPASEINRTLTVYVIDADMFIVAVDTAATNDATGGGAVTWIGHRQYEVTVVDANTYTVQAKNNATATVLAGAGGALREEFLIPVGNETSLSASGYSTGGYSDGYYSAPSSSVATTARTWTLSNLGETLIANYINSPLYRWDNNPSIRAVSISATVTDAPIKNLTHMVTPERFLVALGTSDQPSGTFSPLTVAFADQEKGLTTGDWTPDSTNSAGDFILGGTSRIVSGCAMPGLNLVWTLNELFSIQFVPNLSTIFRPTLIGSGCGLVGQNAWARAGDSGSVYWLSTSKEFMLWAGGTPTTISCPVKDFLFDNLADGQEALIHAGTLDSQNEIYWFYPTTSDAGVTENTRYICLNYALLTWTVGTFDITAFVDRGLEEYPIAAFSDGTMKLMEKGNTANGSAIPSVFLESGWIDTAEGTTQTFVKRYVPDFAHLSGGVNVKILSKDWPQDSNVTTTDLGNISTSTLKKDCRITARQIALRYDWQSNPTDGRLGRIELDLEKTNRLR